MQLAALGAVDHLVDDDQRLEEVADLAVRELLGLPGAMVDWLFGSPEREARAQAYLQEVQVAAATRAWRF
jgi:hypothetical protein